MKFNHERVLVTGGDGALGSGLARAFHQAGADVVAVTRSTPANPIEGVSYAQADLTNPDDVAALFDSGGSPWAVINTVGGFAPKHPLSALDPAELRKQLELNLTTAAILTSHALRVMTQAGEGRIVHTASQAAVRVASAGFSYSVSKAGVIHLVEMAAREVEKTGVRVNAVSPTIIDTPANRKAMPKADHTQWPTPADLAPAYLYLAHPTSTTNGAVLPS
ncbi:MAG TPA: SDR family NAD(P)-dependent oxidoreductase [Beutenbergiaceae bacterium]|nr:SDR family NAD(P)-dependent oxidoreductase [Beutenbergiaceae bacterium]